jgi:hypothetical protein
VSGGTLTLESSVTNNGTLEATGGGTLAIIDNTVTNGSGAITADGGTVNLQGATINDGTLNASAGTMQTTGGQATLNGVTLSSGSAYVTGASETTVLTGTLTNTGVTLKVDGSAANAVIQANTDVTLTGGTVTLISGTGDAFLRPNGHTLTSSARIQGAGVINDTGGTLVNNAAVNANVSGGTLSLESNVTNNGTLEATGGGTLAIIDNTVTNCSGAITADGGTVNLQGATINGGTLNASTGTMQTTGGQATLNGVTLSPGSTYVTGVSETTVLNTSLTNTGATFELDGTSAGDAIAQLNSDTTITGGTVTLISVTGTAFLRPNGHTLTSSALIQGAGIINDTGGTLVKNGTVLANVAGRTLSVETTSPTMARFKPMRAALCSCPGR